MAARIKPVRDKSVPEQVREYFRLAEQRGAPNSTLLRILARDPDSLRLFYEPWTEALYGGRLPHLLKEIVRIHMAELRGCFY